MRSVYYLMIGGFHCGREECAVGDEGGGHSGAVIGNFRFLKIQVTHFCNATYFLRLRFRHENSLHPGIFFRVRVYRSIFFLFITLFPYPQISYTEINRIKNTFPCSVSPAAHCIAVINSELAQNNLSLAYYQNVFSAFICAM